MELATIIALLEQYRYLILFPLASFEGPILGFITGSLVPLGYFSLLPLYAVLIAADVLPDIAYYFLGRWGGDNRLVQKLIKKAGLDEERFVFVRTLWHEQTTKAMLITKFSYGLSTPLLVIAGLVHLPLGRFIKWSVGLAAGQYAVLLTLGYFFGGQLSLVDSAFAKVQLIILSVIIIGVSYYFFTRYMRKAFWKQNI